MIVYNPRRWAGLVVLTSLSGMSAPEPLCSCPAKHSHHSRRRAGPCTRDAKAALRTATRRFGAAARASPCAEIVLKRRHCCPLCRLGLAPGRGVRRRVGDSAASAQARGGQEQLSGPGCRCAACRRQPDSGPWSPLFLPFGNRSTPSAQSEPICGSAQLCTRPLLACTQGSCRCHAAVLPPDTERHSRSRVKSKRFLTPTCSPSLAL